MKSLCVSSVVCDASAIKARAAWAWRRTASSHGTTEGWAWNEQLGEWLDSKIFGTRDHAADRRERFARAKASPTGLAYTEMSPGCTTYTLIPPGMELRGWGAHVDGKKRDATTYTQHGV